MERVVRFVRCMVFIGPLSMPVSALAWDTEPMCTWREAAPTVTSTTTLTDHAPHEQLESTWVMREIPTLDAIAHLYATGAHEEAIAMWRDARAAYPRLDDHLALREADAALERHPTDALVLYTSAMTSVSESVRLEARIGRVRALFALDDPRAAEELVDVLAAYPEQASVLTLRIAQAHALERAGRVEDAIDIYRMLDLDSPGTEAAREAHDRLAYLAEIHSVTPFTLDEQIARASRLVSVGPADDVTETLDQLRAREDLEPRQHAAVLRLAAQVARFEGRFADADALSRQALDVEPRGPVVPEEVSVDRIASARTDLRRITRGRPISTVHPLHLPNVALLAIEGEDEGALLDALEETSKTTIASVRFDVAMVISGSAHDDWVMKLLEPIREGNGELAIGARYHYARALERLGRTDEARAAFTALRGEGANGLYYAVWTHRRLAAITEHGTEHELVHADVEGEAAARIPARTGVQHHERTNEEAANALHDIATVHARRYPWIGRAEDLLRLGARPEAQSELYETYLAWRETQRRGARRTGYLVLDRDDRAVLADVAADIGEYRTAIALGTHYHGDDRPRAFESDVTAAARRYGVDPNLVFAVMRVESVFQPRAVSYVGATGLMQIMPRTGDNIARSLARGDFTTADLFDPRTNIEFGAWYLASLLERFDGRVPLALAAYNGGPHNVRKWIEEHGDDMPVDALVERIPFEQTHRYVRRVLVHYAAYRAERGLEMVELPVRMPVLRTDTVGF